MNQNFDFQHILRIIKNPSSLDQIATSEAEILTKEGYPAEYISFLLHVGYGDLGFMQLYEGPCEIELVYNSNDYPHLRDLVLIGDDFQGYCFAFDPNDSMRVVEIDPWAEVDRSGESTFHELLERFHLAHQEFHSKNS